MKTSLDYNGYILFAVAGQRKSSENEGMPMVIISSQENISSIPKSRGAKPPIEIYQRHHEQSAAFSQSAITSSSSSAEDAKVIDKQPAKKHSDITVQLAESKPPVLAT